MASRGTRSAADMAEQFARTRSYLSELTGGTRAQFRALRLGVSWFGVIALAGVGWGAWQQHRAAEGIERQIVFVSSDGVVMASSPFGQPTGFPDEFWLDFGKRWVASLRAHPTDEGTLRANWIQLAATSDQAVYDFVAPQVDARAKELVGQAIDIEEVSANLIGRPSATRATVFVRWCERKRGASVATCRTATLTEVWRPSTTKGDFQANMTGLYVKSAQFSEEERKP